MPQPHFLGTDASVSPLVPDLLATAHALVDLGVAAGTVSARYGPRTVVNAAGVPLDQLAEAHFVEVADYDPQTDQVLCLGPHAPAGDAGLHALVYRAKAEVWALVQVTVPEGHALAEDVPVAEKARGTLDTAMRVLEKLRNADAVRLGDRDVVVAAKSPRDALERVKALLGRGA